VAPKIFRPAACAAAIRCWYPAMIFAAGVRVKSMSLIPSSTMTYRAPDRATASRRKRACALTPKTTELARTRLPPMPSSTTG